MSDELVLRDYQLASIEGLRQGIREGHQRQLLAAPTGSGKSICSVSLVQEARRKFARVAFLVDRVSLVDQISKTFSQYGIEHGVIQADHWRFRPFEPVQVISTGTLARRDLSKMEPFQLAIVDEGHVMIQSVLKFYEQYPQMRVCALSATPFSRGLGNVYSKIVNVTTTNKLIAEGWLTPMKVYAARAISTKGMKLNSVGEWEPSEIEKRSLTITGDIVNGWLDKTSMHFGGPVKTILFSATVAHGEELCRKFQLAGANFQQVSYKDGNDDRRRALIEEFRKPDSEITGLVSVDALGRGFDVPDIMCMVAARPFRKSLSSWVQQVGRLIRIAPGKDYGLLLDNSNNFIRFRADMEEFFENGINSLKECDLDSKVRKEPEERANAGVCTSCGFALKPTDETCPACGKARPKRANATKPQPGELVEIDGKITKKEGKYPWMKDRAQVQAEIWGFALARKNGDVVAAKKFANAQYRNIYDGWPRRDFENVTPQPTSRPVASYINSMLIRYFRGKDSRKATPDEPPSSPQTGELL